jgi:hypothetical protein
LYLKGVFSSSENDEVVSDKIVVFIQVSIFIVLLETLELHFGLLAVVYLVLVAGLEVDSNDAVWVLGKVCRENFEGHIIVVHFVIAEGYIDIDCEVFSIFKKELLIDISGFFKVASEVVDSGQGKLVVSCILQFMMISHQAVFVVLFVGDVEHQSDKERRFWALSTFSLGLIIVAESIKAASLKDVELLVVVGLSHEIIVYVYGFSTK